jgi:hypothetical protein
MRVSVPELLTVQICDPLYRTGEPLFFERGSTQVAKDGSLVRFVDRLAEARPPVRLLSLWVDGESEALGLARARLVEAAAKARGAATGAVEIRRGARERPSIEIDVCAESRAKGAADRAELGRCD